MWRPGLTYLADLVVCSKLSSRLFCVQIWCLGFYLARIPMCGLCVGSMITLSSMSTLWTEGWSSRVFRLVLLAFMYASSTMRWVTSVVEVLGNSTIFFIEV